MPEVLCPPLQTTPRYIATRDYRGYSYTLDTQNGLAVCCGNGEFVNPSSWELAARVAERLNDGRDPACYHWYPMGLVSFDEVPPATPSTPRKPNAWSVASTIALAITVPPASPAPCFAEAAL